MARKKSGGDQGGGANWMDTYGDLVTLLLCFFVLLFAFSSVDATKWKQLKAAFTNEIMPIAEPQDPGMPNLADPVQTSGGQVEGQEFDKLYQNVQEYIEENQLKGSILAEKNDSLIKIRFLEKIMFDSGRADLYEEGKERIRQVGELIAASQQSIESLKVEGHTDTDPIDNDQYADNWQLGAGRAYVVMDYMFDNGIIDEKGTPMTVAGVTCGDRQPIATNATVEGKAQNRRVDFVLTERK